MSKIDGGYGIRMDYKGFSYVYTGAREGRGFDTLESGNYSHYSLEMAEFLIKTIDVPKRAILSIVDLSTYN